MILISAKKRIIVIIFLIIFGSLLFTITKTYEKHLISNIDMQTMTNYDPFKKTSNFKGENGERYIRYYSKNKKLSYEDIVTRVNIGLDYDYYGYIKKADMNKGILVLTNKYTKLDDSYIPNDLEKIDSKYFINKTSANMLRHEAREEFEKLSEASIKNGTPVYGQSAFRSYDRQEELYNNAVEKNGQEVADFDTARPGHSEHQTGLTIDVSSNKKGNMLDFENSLSHYWMLKNAHKYGFILRYPKGKEKIHGFVYESWHYRYIGVKAAADMHDNYSDLTFDEYYYKFID